MRLHSFAKKNSAYVCAPAGKATNRRGYRLAKVNNKIVPSAPRILQVATNLTTAKSGDYIELAFAPTSPGNHLAMEVMNITGAPLFGGGNGASWQSFPIGTASVLGVTSTLGPPGTTAGVNVPIPGMLIGFVAEIEGLVETTAAAIEPLMTNAKVEAIQTHGSWLNATLERSASYAYRRRNACDFDDDLDTVMRKLGHLPEDAIREMVCGGLEDLIRSLLDRRPVVDFERSVDHVLLDEVDRAKALKRPALELADFAEPEKEDEVATVDAEVRRLAIAPGDENFVVNREMLRWFCQQLQLSDLDRQIVCHLFKDPMLPTTALAKRCGRSPKWIGLRRRVHRIAHSSRSSGRFRFLT